MLVQYCSMSLVHGPVQHAVMLGGGSKRFESKSKESSKSQVRVKSKFGDLRGGKGLSVLFACSFGLFCLVLINCLLISVSPSNSSASFVFSILVTEEIHQYLILTRFETELAYFFASIF